MRRRETLDLLAVFAGLLALTFWLRRLYGLFSVADWDESLYLLMARSALEGHLPYVAVFDNKPPGIYALFAASQVVFGQSVEAVRTFTCIAVAATGTALFALTRRVVPAGYAAALAGLLAGVLYAIYSAKIGRASNTELFFAPFSVTAVLFVVGLTGPAPVARIRLRAAVAGLAAGCAVLIKPLAAADVLAAVVFAGVMLRARSGEGARRRRAWIPWLVFFAALPALAVVLAYAAAGALPYLIEATVHANVRLAGLLPRDTSVVLGSVAAHVAGNWPLWAASATGLAMALVKRRQEPRGNAVMGFALVWLVLTLVTVIASGAAFPHYFLQLLPPLCVLAGGVMLAMRHARGRAPAWLTAAVALAFVAVVMVRENGPLQRDYALVTAERQRSGNPHWGDNAAAVSAYLRERLRPGDGVWVVDYEPIVYYLAREPLPTRYAFPPFLADTTLARVAGVDPVRELERILANAPRYLVRGRPMNHPAFYERLQPILNDWYEEDAGARFFRIYRLRDGAADSLRAAVGTH